MNFSENVKRFRSEKQLTQEKLAESLNVSRQAVSKWESGQGYPEIEKLVKLSDLFEITLDELVKAPADQLIVQPEQTSADVPVTNMPEKKTSTLFGIAFDPDLALKFFWGGVKLGAAATIAAFLTN